jgi:hypothetical protein
MFSRYKFRNNKDLIKPKRFYEELAEMGALEDFIESNLKKLYESAPEFKEEMLEIILRKSNKYNSDLETMYLENLCETMEYFLEYNKIWLNQKP